MNVCTHVAELPHASVAVYVYERVLLQPVPTSLPRAEAVTVALPEQTSVAVAVAAAGNVLGLQPKLDDAGHDVNTGTVVSTV